MDATGYLYSTFNNFLETLNRHYVTFDKTYSCPSEVPKWLELWDILITPKRQISLWNLD